DSSNLLTGSLDTKATAASPVGSYPFSLGTLDAGPNYCLVLPADAPTFAVTPATLTITPGSNQSRVYGAPVPALTYTASGFKNGDSSNLLTGSLDTKATAASPVAS